MGEMITYQAQDGMRLSAYQAQPTTTPKGGLILLQEIFGLNPHIKDVCDSYAQDGWHVIAPALFDRAEKEVALAYNPDGKTKGLALKAAVDETAQADIASLISLFDEAQKIAVIGYCWGGSLAWRMACATDLFDAAVCYYGGELSARKDDIAHCPVLAHFGRFDATIAMEVVTAFMAAQPDVACHIYEAEHGFNCDHRSQYDAPSSQAARARTDAFLTKCLGGGDDK